MDEMAEPWRNAHVLVTGAAGGIGGAVAELFVEGGASVYLTDVDDIAGRKRALALGPRAHYHRLDVTDESGWQAVATAMEQAGHRLNVLVNSAGSALKAPLAQTTTDQFRAMIEQHLVGTFLGLRTAAHAMTAGGAIVNISSLRGVLATAELGAYGAAKSGVHTLTKIAALELAHQGIRVNSVSPGSITTEITSAPGFAADDMQAYVQSIPMRRRGAPEEVAAVIAFLAGAGSSYMTGVDLLVDGGTAAGVRTPKLSNQKA